MPFSYGMDVLRPAFEDREVPYIAYGSRFDALCATHVEQTLNASRVYIIASRSLSAQTDSLKRLQHALGDKVVGTRIGISPHTRWHEVVEIALDASKVQPDCIVTLGAGSITDGSKIIAWMLANDVTTAEGLEEMFSGNANMRKDLKPPSIRVISIPTSLSGGEYQSIAGVTRSDGSNQKCLFEPPTRNPSLVILDPELTTTTPERIWLSSGIRAVDHCVETLCSLASNEAGDKEAEKGLAKLVPGLLKTKHDPKDLDARFECQLGVIEAMSAVGSGVPLGASHAIGHQLGPLGVGHGETSCVMLPAVCQWNEKVGANVERQKQCKEVLMRDSEVMRLIGDKGQGMDLGQILDKVIRELGMPRSLKDVGVGRDQLEDLARTSLNDHWIKTNPMPITKKEQVMEILEMVVE